MPEAWEKDELMDRKRRAFYEYHSAIQEPWDGPALLSFFNGRYAGAVLDRNGLRPARILEFKDGRVLLASELGLLPISADNISKKKRLKPGKFFLIDFEQKRIVRDREFKHAISTSKPYDSWLSEQKVTIDQLMGLESKQTEYARSTLGSRGLGNLLDTIQTGSAALHADPKLKAFNYTTEQINLLLTPMVSSTCLPPSRYDFSLSCCRGKTV